MSECVKVKPDPASEPWTNTLFSSTSVRQGVTPMSRQPSRKSTDSNPCQPQSTLFGDCSDVDVAQLVSAIRSLPAMDKVTMSGRCLAQTRDMERFMTYQVGMCPLPGKSFVAGVKAFELDTPLEDLPREHELVYASGDPRALAAFRMSVAEVLEWQRSYRAFYAADVYVGSAGLQTLRRSLQGRSKPGEEASRMKFVVRSAETPVIMCFDGRVLPREAHASSPGKVYLVSACGINFAARMHDCEDVTRYIKNWKQVYQLESSGAPKLRLKRDFVPTGRMAVLDQERCLYDLKTMARLRLRAQDSLGIQVVVESALGLGVFAGDSIGIGDLVRRLSAQAIKEVLEQERFRSIKLVVCSLPIFPKHENYSHFSRAFGDERHPYTGCTPVVLADQDMHAIALEASQAGFAVGELNPADSHGVFGEYWQNLGPGTEEKLALTTCGLLTQHHAVNPAVLCTSRYVAVDTSTTTP